jgi:beta-phosphoglucomutase
LADVVEALPADKHRTDGADTARLIAPRKPALVTRGMAPSGLAPDPLQWGLNNTPKAILLDFDGTLVDSEPLHYRCWSEAVRPWGAATDWEDYQRRFVGITDREGARILLSEAGHEPTAELIREACAIKHQLYRSRCGGELTIPAESASLIVELGSIVMIGIVTSSIELELGPVLAKAGLSSTIRVMVCGNHVERHKPDPEPYRLAFKQLKALSNGISEADCLVFEDSAAGVAAATAAGMRVSRVRHPSDLAAQMRREVSIFGNGA